MGLPVPVPVPVVALVLQPLGVTVTVAVATGLVLMPEAVPYPPNPVAEGVPVPLWVPELSAW